MMSFFWYAAIKFVIARISGSFLYLQKWKELQRVMKINLQDLRGCHQKSYGLASCPSKGFTSDSINILARTRYLIRSKRKIMIGNHKELYKVMSYDREDVLMIVLETLDSPWIASFVVVFECFKEISRCVRPLPLSHVHLPTTFTNYTHNSWMRYC